MALPAIKAVLTFEVVARLGSISGAGEELHLTPSAVSHQITNLENHIGRKLFKRTARGMELTPAGQRYHQSLSGALAVIASAAEDARADGFEILRIQSSPSFAVQWLMPRLSRFVSEHPTIKFRLSASHLHSDFSRGDVDVDIRYGLTRWNDMHVETIFTEEILPMVSPALKKRLDVRNPKELLGQNLILSNVNLIQWPQWFAAQGVPMSPSQYALSFDRAYLSIQAAIQGLGIALESDRLAAEPLEQGLLVPLFSSRLRMQTHGHHLVFPHSHAERNRVARFVEWIRKEADAQ